MTEEEAISRASQWVQSHFPAVPPVASALYLDQNDLQQYEAETGRQVGNRKPGQPRDKWIIAYFCSWDTDAMGMPETLHVAVDDSTGEVCRFWP